MKTESKTEQQNIRDERNGPTSCHVDTFSTALSRLPLCCTWNKASSLRSGYFSQQQRDCLPRAKLYGHFRAPIFSPITLSRAPSDNVTSRLHGNETPPTAIVKTTGGHRSCKLCSGTHSLLVRAACANTLILSIIRSDSLKGNPNAATPRIYTLEYNVGVFLDYIIK